MYWVKPKLVAKVKYLTWTEDNLLRQVVYDGLRNDKPAAEVCRPMPYPKPDSDPQSVSTRQSRSPPL